MQQFYLSMVVPINGDWGGMILLLNFSLYLRVNTRLVAQSVLAVSYSSRGAEQYVGSGELGDTVTSFVGPNCFAKAYFW